MISRLLALAVLVAIFTSFATGALERLLLYPLDPAYAAAPDRMTETALETADGTRLVVWSARPQFGKPVVVYFPGNAGNLANRARRFAAFIDRGFGVVSAGYRGSSGSTGKASEVALTADALALAEALPGLVGPARTVYYGESLGSAVAIALALERAPAGMVLEAPFASIADMSESLYGSRPLSRVMKSTWPNVERIARVRAPLLVLHGKSDELVPIDQGRAVHAAAASFDKTFLAVAAGHTDVWQVEPQIALYRFLDRF